MKILKFRVWGIVTKHFLDQEEVWERLESLSEDEVFDVQQFTGIYDLNGKEIYEGDLIETKSLAGVEIHGEVIFEDGSFVARWGYKNPPAGGRTDYFMSARLNSTWVVVGNIYENGEKK